MDQKTSPLAEHELSGNPSVNRGQLNDLRHRLEDIRQVTGKPQEGYSLTPAFGKVLPDLGQLKSRTR